MKFQILLIIVILGWNDLSAQQDIKMINALPFNSEKYKDFKGSPYLWEENKEVIIYDKRGVEYSSAMGNYNGLENEFEVYKDDSFIQLPHSTYISIKVINDDKTNYSLFSNIHSKLKNKYCIRHKRSENYSVFESFQPRKSVVKLETPGKATVISKIIPKTKYYIIYGAELIPFEIKKKKLYKQFGHKDEIKKFLKENKLKIKTINDVLPLFEFLDSKGWLAPKKD